MVDERKIAEALPAASVLLVRDGEGGLEVLMMERAKTMRFAPGAFVFPGGKVDAEDSDKALWHELTNATVETDDFAFRVAVLRELYEETSVLLTTEEQSDTVAGQNFRALISSAPGVLNVEGLVPFAHWVTPETMPRRFDTYFYIAPHNGQTAVHDGDEAISLRWVAPSTLLDDWDSDKVPLMFPTRLNLIKLARANSVAEAMEQARNTVVVCIMPTVTQGENGVCVSITEASGYGVTQATDKELKIERPK